MLTYIINHKCEGDEKHKAHSEPSIMIAVAESAKETLDIEAMVLAITLLDGGKNIKEISRSSEGIRALIRAIGEVLEATTEDSFSKVAELDPEVEF
jgi:hypothetical protein